ncbi:hypothetical protein SAY86_002203 [Trapa natans]|uniref:E3 ubiquitin-protein ligase PRT1 n=1 Tax=Trapa natans TaxID=22666 RepID=A0AAN7LIS6_TRANT|nr:hypothetical protein SAY86_002203 [Trapa natans]
MSFALAAEEEKKIGTFSPQIDGHMYHQISEEKLNGSSQSCESAECSISANAVSSCNVVIQEEDSPEIRLNKNSKQISKSDLLCVSCNQLLFRPTVLNCGHVYCQSCLSIPANEKPKCQECESLHPGDLPCVCWELDHFLEDQFPEEYSVKRCEAKSKGIDSPSESSKAYTLGNCKDDEQHDSLLLLKTHFTVGCDYCGMYPIIGDRYKCKGCIEEIGFDLCGDCYKSQSKLPGRFNQQHKPEHKFEHIKLRANPNYLLSLMTGIISSGGYAQFEIATNSLSSVPNPPADGAEDSELDLALPLVFDAIPEDDLSETEET